MVTRNVSSATAVSRKWQSLFCLLFPKHVVEAACAGVMLDPNPGLVGGCHARADTAQAPRSGLFLDLDAEPRSNSPVSAGFVTAMERCALVATLRRHHMPSSHVRRAFIYRDSGHCAMQHFNVSHKWPEMRS